jgi:hypothetical protein
MFEFGRNGRFSRLLFWRTEGDLSEAGGGLFQRDGYLLLRGCGVALETDVVSPLPDLAEEVDLAIAAKNDVSGLRRLPGGRGVDGDPVGLPVGALQQEDFTSGESELVDAQRQLLFLDPEGERDVEGAQVLIEGGEGRWVGG